MSTHLRNRDAKISRAPNGKTMSDWVCFNKIQDKIWHFLRGGHLDNYGVNIDDFEIIKDLLGYEIDFQVVTPDSNQSRDASSEVSLLSDENLTSQPLENSATSSNEVSDGILSPLKMSNLSEDMSMEKDSEDDVSTPQKKSDGSQASLLGLRKPTSDDSDDTSIKSLKSMDDFTVWTERGLFVILALPDLFQATLHLRTSVWDKFENTKVPDYGALILKLIRMNRNILLHCISAKIQVYLKCPPKVAGIGQSNQARSCSQVAELVI